MLPFVESLEPRQLLSASISSDNAPDAHAPEVTVAITASDRRELLSHFFGDVHASLRKTLRHSGAAAFDASLLKYMVRRAGPSYFFNGHQLARTMEMANRTQIDGIGRVRNHADDVLAHRFPEQVNSDEYTVQLGDNVDWDALPAATDNADFLHSLNRHTFWRELGNAYRLTGDGAYVRELVAQLGSWSEQTPALADADDWADSSPHWWLLDAADRVNNWVYTYFMVLGSSDWTPAANTLFLQRLWDHGDFLANVTPGAVIKNRTALHAGSLQMLGMLFPEFDQAGAWEYAGTDLLFRCLGEQFRPDGGHVEQTPAYQASAASAFLSNYYLAQLNGKTYWTRNRRVLLTSAVEVLYRMTSGGGMPGLSDSYRASSPGRLLAFAAHIFDMPKYNGAEHLDTAILVADRFGDEDFRNVDPDPLATYAMPDSGYYFMWANGTRLIVDAGPKGGTHGHYDLLSFEWNDNVLDQPYIPDPGPYRYDESAERQYVISTPAHNTISVDGLNHEAIEEPHSPKIVVDEFTASDTEFRFTAHHHAYAALAGAPVVGRTIFMHRSSTDYGTVIVVDWARSETSHEFTSTFNLGTATATQTAPGVVDNQLTRTTWLRLQTLAAGAATYALDDSFISSNPPPEARTDTKRYRVTQSGTSALSVTLLSKYTPTGFKNKVPATIEWEDGAPPAAGQTVRLKLTLPTGQVRHLEFVPPDLTS